IRVQQDLKLKRLAPFVPHVHHRLQPITAQRDAVDEPEVVRPGLAGLRGEIGTVQPEVKLYAVVAALGQRAGLRGRLAQEFPAGIAGEAVLGEGRSRVVRRRGPEVLRENEVSGRLSCEHSGYISIDNLPGGGGVDMRPQSRAIASPSAPTIRPYQSNLR